MNKLIGILGGTFDPIHRGHLALAHAVQQHCQLTQMRFIPCAQPALGKRPVATAQHRWTMLTQTVDQNPNWVADDQELQRGGTSYTIDTLRTLRAKEQHSRFCLIMAIDTFAHFKQWQEWEAILQYVHLIVTNRPGYPLKKIMHDWLEYRAENIESLQHAKAGLIFQINFTAPDISSTLIREELKSNQSVKDYLLPCTLDYIERHKLYR